MKGFIFIANGFPYLKMFLRWRLFTKLCLQKRIWLFRISFMSDSFTLLQQITSTSDVDFHNPSISWRKCVRCSLWSCCFCNLISFSSLAFPTLSILYGRISSFLFFYFLILSCLLYLAILISFPISNPTNHHFSYC